MPPKISEILKETLRTQATALKAAGERPTGGNSADEQYEIGQRIKNMDELTNLFQRFETNERLKDI